MEPTIAVTLKQGEAWVIYQAMLGVKDAAARAIVESGTNEYRRSIAEAKYATAERVIVALTMAV
jgi:hypothetical protein